LASNLKGRLKTTTVIAINKFQQARSDSIRKFDMQGGARETPLDE
jgi:hypothetical protein